MAEVNYEDERFQKVETDQEAAVNELEQTYAGMIGDTDQYYNAQIDATKQWETQQSQLQQEQTDFTIEQIEQQKDRAQKDYTKEQSGAYTDWQKQTDAYGVAEEQQAAAGMSNTGYSESTQAAMYNQYQNRVATARQSYQQAVVDYDNAIKEAQLQNNAALAEIAYQSLQTRLTLALEGFQYKNDLLLDQVSKKTELDQMYYGRWQDVLQQINTENAMAEETRQWEQSYALQVQQLEESKRQFELEYNEGIRQFNEEIARLKANDAQANAMQIQQLELEKEKLEETKRQFDEEMAMAQAELDEEKRQFDVKNTGTVYSGGSGTGTDVTIRKDGATDTAAYAAAIAAGNTANAKDKQSQLSRMSGRLSGEAAIANYIVAYANAGTINTNEAAYLLDQFGYDLSDYFE